MTRAPRVAALLAGLFLIDALLIRAGALRGIDDALLGWDRIVGADHPFGGSPHLLAALLWTTALGAAPARIGATLAAAALLATVRRGREAVILVAASASAAAALPLLKLLFGRARPDRVWWLVVERHHSFPSGHAMGSMLLYPLIGLAIDRGRAGVATMAGVALALLVGATRVLLGVHWASDVIGGWLIGGAWALAAASLFRLPRRNRTIDPSPSSRA